MLGRARVHQAADGQINHVLGSFGPALVAAIQAAITSEPAMEFLSFGMDTTDPLLPVVAERGL